MAKIRISVAGDANLQLELQRALAALSSISVSAEGKTLMYYAIITVPDVDCDPALETLRQLGFNASFPQ